jgi:hypothetical protein
VAFVWAAAGFEPEAALGFAASPAGAAASARTRAAKIEVDLRW